MSSPACPLCLTHSSSFYHEDKRRSYWQCGRCALVFVEPSSLPEPETELAVYQQHENGLADLGYRRFLNKLAAPLLARLPAAQSGLDFGCGPGPLLAQILTEAGHSMALYDPFFAPERDVLEREYDFVTCTEAIEHFHQPHHEWQQLLSRLKPGGYLGVMTKLVISPERFANWHYKLDPTHVSFFSRPTFEFLAQRDNLSLDFVADDAMILQRLG